LNSGVSNLSIMTFSLMLMQGLIGGARATGQNLTLDLNTVAHMFDEHRKFTALNSKNKNEFDDNMMKLYTDLQNACYNGMHLDFMISPTTNQI